MTYEYGLHDPNGDGEARKKSRKAKKALKKARKQALSDGKDAQDVTGLDLQVGNSAKDAALDRTDPSALAHYVRMREGEYRRKQLEDDVRLLIATNRMRELADEDRKAKQVKPPKGTVCKGCAQLCKGKGEYHQCQGSCNRVHIDPCASASAGKGPLVPQAAK